MIALFCVLYTFKKAFAGHIDQPSGILADMADAVGPGRVRVVSFEDDAGIQAHDISLPDKAVRAGYTVYDLLIYGDADGSRISVVVQKGGYAAVAAYQLLSYPVYIQGSHSRTKLFCQFIVDSLEYPS